MAEQKMPRIELPHDASDFVAFRRGMVREWRRVIPLLMQTREGREKVKSLQFQNSVMMDTLSAIVRAQEEEL